jgi:hypothetical protein
MSLYSSPEITKRALELKQDLDRKVVELEANAGTPETESPGMVQATMIAFDGTEVSVATKVPPRKYRTGPYLSFRSTEKVLSMAWEHPEIGTPILVGVSYWDESKSKGEFSIGFARAKAEFEEATRHWVDDGYRKELVELFARPEIEIPPGITKLVAFGLGFFCLEGAPGKEQAAWDKDRWDTAIQHVAFQEVGDVLQQHLQRSCSKTRIERYAQDPSYYDTDKEVLTAVDIHPLQDVEGFLKLDSNSVVFATKHIDAPIKELVFSVCRPAMIIWEKWEEPTKVDKAAAEEGLWKLKEKLGGS